MRFLKTCAACNPFLRTSNEKAKEKAKEKGRKILTEALGICYYETPPRNGGGGL